MKISNNLPVEYRNTKSVLDGDEVVLLGYTLIATGKWKND